MTIWISGDFHLSHFNIIRYTNRPFHTVEEMNETIINNFNSEIGEYDQVIFLGDFCFGNPNQYLSRLRGNWTFIKGNHDHDRSLNTYISYLVLEYNNKEIFCIHRPDDYSSSYKYNFVAHVHDRWKVRKVYSSYLVNVGVDVWAFHPITIDDTMKAIAEYDNNNKV